MPWKESTTMSQRTAFIERAKAEGANISALCREFGISRKTGYKWLKRAQTAGEAGESIPLDRLLKGSEARRVPAVGALLFSWVVQLS